MLNFKNLNAIMAAITLEGMKFYAYHGVYAEEQVIGGEYIVDLYIAFDTKAAAVSDDLDKTIDYEKIYSIIKAEMNIKSKLIENVAARILDSIGSKFSDIESLKVKVHKLHPPFTGEVKKVTVEMER